MKLKQVYNAKQEYDEKIRNTKSYFKSEEAKEIIKKLNEDFIKKLNDILYPIS